jgi:hypothetical protein
MFVGLAVMAPVTAHVSIRSTLTLTAMEVQTHIMMELDAPQ